MGAEPALPAHPEFIEGSPWDERASPTTVLPSGVVVLGVDQWFQRLEQGVAADNTVTRLALDGTTLGSFPVGSRPRALAYGGNSIWVANDWDGTVTRISLE